MASRPLFATARDGTSLFVQDWGTGKPVLLLAAWTFNSSVWGSQIVALNAKGYRCVAPGGVAQIGQQRGARSSHRGMDVAVDARGRHSAPRVQFLELSWSSLLAASPPQSRL